MIITLILSLAYSLYALFVSSSSVIETVMAGALTITFGHYLYNFVLQTAKVRANTQTEALSAFMSGPATSGKSYVSSQFRALYPSPSSASLELARLYKHLALRISVLIVLCAVSAGYHGTAVPLYGVIIAMAITGYLYASYKNPQSYARVA